MEDNVHRQLVYLANSTRLIRHLAAAAKRAKVRAGHFKKVTPESANEWMATGALEAYCVALGAALLDDMGQHHYTFAEAAQRGLDWLTDHEDLIDV